MLFTEETVQMYEAALEALLAIYKAVEGNERMGRWGGSVLASLAVLWCNLKEGGNAMQATEQRVSTKCLEEEMKKVVAAILDDGGVDAVKDVQRIRACEPDLFAGLFD